MQDSFKEGVTVTRRITTMPAFSEAELQAAVDRV